MKNLLYTLVACFVLSFFLCSCDSVGFVSGPYYPGPEVYIYQRPLPPLHYSLRPEPRLPLWRGR